MLIPCFALSCQPIYVDKETEEAYQKEVGCRRLLVGLAASCSADTFGSSPPAVVDGQTGAPIRLGVLRHELVPIRWPCCSAMVHLAQRRQLRPRTTFLPSSNPDGFPGLASKTSSNLRHLAVVGRLVQLHDPNHRFEAVWM